ncbi:MAG: hypothetical protein JXR45_11685, partial [Deltaproteobacteria bacterium]|nr:hypothetical protein [Deltaproteobacteria bacterium]
MSEMQPHMKKRVGIALLLTGLGVVFAAVYYWATPTGGVIPSMPKVRIDSKQMDFAVKRFHQRAASVEITPFHEQLQAAFFALNSAEVSGSDASAINGLRQEFVQKTEIAQTARKERYLQFGDFLAKQFETELFQVLESAHAQGMEQVMHAKP